MANEEYCNQLKRRIAELEKENAELRAQLGLSDINATDTIPPAEVENSPSATVHKYRDRRHCNYSISYFR